MTSRLTVFLDRTRHWAELVSGLMFAAIFAVFIAGIFMRYAVHRPLLWGDEVAMLLLIWCTLLTDAFVVRSGDHVALDVVWDTVGLRARRVIGIAGRAIFALIFLFALPTVLDYVLFLWRERTDVLELRLDLVFFCFVIYIVMVIVRLLAQLAAFCGPDWRAHVGGAGAPTTNVIG